VGLLEALGTDHDRAQVVPDVLKPDEIAQLLTQLKSLKSWPIAPDPSPLAPIRQWGAMSGPTPLEPGGPEPATYERRNQALWTGVGPLSSKVRLAVVNALGTLSTATVAVVPGRHVASVRCMPDGCGAPRHLDRYPETAAYSALRARCDIDAQLVWYLMLRASPRGGHLRTFPGNRKENEVPNDDDYAVDYPLSEGSLLIHPGASTWHEVSPPQGGDRLTLGGICAPRRDGGGWWICA
jgi:hypothetical protein